jgi:hypothetical protein
MEKEFDLYEFENYLTEEFFNGNEVSEIEVLINERLKSDKEFGNQYELWLDESGNDSWKDYYLFLLEEEETAWENIFTEDEDDDDAITDYLTKE